MQTSTAVEQILKLGKQLETGQVSAQKVFRAYKKEGRSFVDTDYAHHFLLTRERIRQIEARALQKLRHPRHRRRLQNFIEN